jgi:predicted TIM-barrel fold metal-dependent hydrolase
MSSSTLTRPLTEPASRLRVIDCDVHPVPRDRGEIGRYLPRAWQEHWRVYGHRLRQPFLDSMPYPKAAPALSRRDAWPPGGGPPGSDLDFVRAQHLDPHGLEYGLLFPLRPRGIDERNLDFGNAMCQAMNDWQVDCWTSREPRLKGAINVLTDDPLGAVAEIRRCAGNRDFRSVQMATRTNEPLGRRRYWPIFEAAAQHDLPLGLHNNGMPGHAVTGGGAPSYYFEEHQAVGMTMAAMVTSLVMEGVFERFPDLRVVVIEGGFGWVPSLTWRLDRHWEVLRSEVPHLKHPPSVYIKRNIWFTTQPVEEPEHPEDLRHVLDWIGWDRLLFSSDYPHWDSDDPRYAFKIPMSEAERRMIFAENARAVFRLD